MMPVKERVTSMEKKFCGRQAELDSQSSCGDRLLKFQIMWVVCLVVPSPLKCLPWNANFLRTCTSQGLKLHGRIRQFWAETTNRELVPLPKFPDRIGENSTQVFPLCISRRLWSNRRILQNSCFNSLIWSTAQRSISVLRDKYFPKRRNSTDRL